MIITSVLKWFGLSLTKAASRQLIQVLNPLIKTKYNQASKKNQNKKIIFIGAVNPFLSPVAWPCGPCNRVKTWSYGSYEYNFFVCFVE